MTRAVQDRKVPSSAACAEDTRDLTQQNQGNTRHQYQKHVRNLSVSLKCSGDSFKPLIESPTLGDFNTSFRFPELSRSQTYIRILFQTPRSSEVVKRQAWLSFSCVQECQFHFLGDSDPSLSPVDGKVLDGIILACSGPRFWDSQNSNLIQQL